MIETLPSTPVPPSKTPVWYFWTGTPSRVVDLCVSNWARHLPAHKYTLRRVGLDNVRSLLDPKVIPCISTESDLPALQSDIIRLALLHKYGGIYLDATVVLTAPLDWFWDGARDGYLFQAYYNPFNMIFGSQDFPVVETSVMFAAKPGLPIVKAWLDAISTIGECTFDARERWLQRYIDDRIRIPLGRDRRYFATYHAFQVALIQVNGLPSFHGVRLWNANDEKLFVCSSVLCHIGHKLGVYNGGVYNGTFVPGRLLKLAKVDRERLEKRLHENTVYQDTFIQRELLPDVNCPPMPSLSPGVITATVVVLVIALLLVFLLIKRKRL